MLETLPINLFPKTEPTTILFQIAYYLHFTGAEYATE